MKIRGLKDEDFVNYKKAAMFIGCVYCDWKCCFEQNLDKSICQNAALIDSDIVNISISDIYQRYTTNPITKAIVLGGLEPFLQFDDIYEMIQYFRNHNCEDDFVIYTGYYKNELTTQINKLSKYKNIIIKFGRYIPDQEKHYDNLLGVYLVSNNQYSERIS